MATGSNIFSGTTYAKYQTLYLVFNQISQDIANNRTLFSYEAYIQGNATGASGSTTNGSYTISGATSASATREAWSWTTATKQTIASDSFYVNHNNDGTLTTQTLSISASFKTTSGTATSSTSASLTVPTIPRYAAITAFTASINDLSASLSWTADKTVSQWRWSSNSGSTYSNWISVNNSSGSTSVSVTPGSSYDFRIQVRASDSGLDTTSSTLSRTATKTPSTLSFNTTSQYVGNSIAWSVNNSYNYTHKITYAFGNTSGYILGSGSAASNTTTDTWTVPIALANQIPNATSGSGTIYVYTYYGSTHIGTKSYAFTATVPNNATFQPTASISSIVESGDVPSWMTVFVQNQSKAKVTSSGTGKYSSSIRTYAVSVANIGTYYDSVITSDTLRNSGSVRVTLTVTDSRGLQGSTYQDINVVAYSPPQLPTFNARRSESTPADISANFNASISPISNQNNKYFRIRSKASDGSWVLETDSTQSYTFSGTQTIVSNPDKSYTIEFFVQDAFTSVTQTVQVGTAFTLLDFNASGKGMAIGKVSESNNFEVAMPAVFNQGIKSPYGRTTSADLPVAGDNTVKTFLAASAMTTGKPQGDGFITHYEWDNSGGWSSQLYVPNDVSSGKSLQFRKMVSGVWSQWYTMWGSTNSNVMIDSGSNSNGQYIKFSDGTMICYGKKTSTFPILTAWGTGMFYSPSHTLTFPATFVGEPVITGTVSHDNIFALSSYTSGGFIAYVLRPAALSETSMTIGYTAIGRWK